MEMEMPSTPAEPSRQAATGAGEMRPNGPVAAVMLATGIGALVLGVLTVLSEASEGIHEFLEFSERVGPLSGKTIFATLAFLLSWGGLHMALREREVQWRPVIIALIALVAIALLLTFPPFFQLFKSE
jgi:NhaP-type Na+/H+ or K+/H+ antiporter